MKKLRLLTLLALPVIAVPFLATMTGCNSLSNTRLKEINISNYPANTTTYGNLPYSSQDFRSLVYGSSDFHKGNYCIFIANSQAKNFLSWLFDNTPLDNCDPINNMLFRSSTVKTSLDEIKSYCEQLKTDFGCTFLLEQNSLIGSPNDYSEHMDTYKITNPFRTWDAVDKNADNSLNVGDYVRNDSDAINYRYIVNTLISLFPGNTKVSALNAVSGGVMAGLIYKDGKPVTEKFLDSTSSKNWVADGFFNEWKDIYNS